MNPKYTHPREGLVIKDLSKDSGVYFKDGFYDSYFDNQLIGRTEKL